MYDLDEIKQFAFPWLVEQLNRLTHGNEADRISALGVLSDTCWRWTLPAVRGLLPDRSNLLTEHLLHGLYALDPRVGVEMAWKLHRLGNQPAADVAHLVLAQMPVRLRGPDALAPLSTQHDAMAPRYTIARWLTATDPLVRVAAADLAGHSADRGMVTLLFKHLGDWSPAVVRGCLIAIHDLAPILAVDAAKLACRAAKGAACLQVATEFLLQHELVTLDQLAQILREAIRDEDRCLHAIARALIRWRPDEFLASFQHAAGSSSRRDRSSGVNMAFEFLAVELGFPTADSSRRIAHCRDLCIGLLADRDEFVRATAIVCLAELDWPQWQRRANMMVMDKHSVVRIEAIGVLDDRNGAADPDALKERLGDSNHGVRQRAFLLLCKILPSGKMLLDAIEQAGLSLEGDDRAHAIAMLAQLGEREGYAIVTRLSAGRRPVLRDAALRAGAELVPKDRGWLRRVHRALAAEVATTRVLALQLLGDQGGETDLPLIIERFADSDASVRLAALRAGVRLAPGRRVELARQLLTDGNKGVLQLAISILADDCSTDRIAAIILEALPRAEGRSGAFLLERIGDLAVDRLMEASELALGSEDAKTRCAAARVFASKATIAHIERLHQLLLDSEPAVRLHAIDALVRLLPREAISIALVMLADRNWRVRSRAVELLTPVEDPRLVEHLLPLARDENENVRGKTLLALAKFDDRRVFGELMSSLNDVSQEVARTAERIVAGELGSVPSMERANAEMGEQAWSQVRHRIEMINRWAGKIGWELLAKKVVVQNYRQGFGRTRLSRKSKTVTIEVTDSPVVSGHPHGEDIVRGLVLHEIGHHVCDFGVRGAVAMRGIARSEGLGNIFDILLDERLERVLRARRAEWGVYFDRLASYAFAQTIHQVPLAEYARLVEKSVAETEQLIRQGALPGQLMGPDDRSSSPGVALRDVEMLSIPELVTPQMAFLACLRCGLDPRLHPDPKVAEAVALVPRNLKDLKHKDVLAVARQIGQLLGTAEDLRDQTRRLRRQIRAHSVVLSGLGHALDRLVDTGQMMDVEEGAAGIRRIEVVQRAQSVRRAPDAGISTLSGKGLNLGSEIDFELLQDEVELKFDATAHEQLVTPIRKHIRHLRAYFERLATRSVDQFAARRGRRLDLAQVRRIPLGGQVNVLVHAHDEVSANAYIGVLVDRSGSMSGVKLERAKTFAALVAESARGLIGVQGHLHAFDDDTIFSLGDFQRTTVASLTSGGGNNDSGALAWAADLALKSNKRNKLLVMISDGSPTECTFESLRNLVARLTRRHGIVCAQVAVESLEHVAFPHYVDLSELKLDEAVARFGKLVVRLTRSWRQ